MSSQAFSVLRLRVTADADPGVLARVLERFQNLNVLPRRVIAEFSTADTLQIQIDISGLSEAAVDLIAAKLGQVPSISNTHWHHA